MKNQTNLVNTLVQEGIIKNEIVAHIMKMVDRGKYCGTAGAYEDHPANIGFNATISAPHMHAYALEYLLPNLKNGSSVLDVGSGSGFLTACFGLLVGPSGKVYGIDHIPELIEQSKRNLMDDHPELISNKVIEFKGKIKLTRM
jgi:protein-L-isoaspartate(D-aspartate) O-methyltransferase